MKETAEDCTIATSNSLTLEELDKAYEILMTYDRCDLANWIIEITSDAGIRELLANHKENNIEMEDEE